MSLADALRRPWHENKPFGICGGCAKLQLLHYVQSVTDHLWGEVSLLSPMTIDRRTDDRKERSVWFAFFFVVKFCLTFGLSVTVEVSGFADRLGAVCVTAQLLFWPAKRRKNVWQSETGRGENVLKTDKPCLDGRLQVCLCVQMSSWVNWLCCRVGVCVSAHSSLTTAACHYRPWLLFTGASWPVEVHLGGLPHLSGPGLGLKLIYRPLIWCLVLIVLADYLFPSCLMFLHLWIRL